MRGPGVDVAPLWCPECGAPTAPGALWCAARDPFETGGERELCGAWLAPVESLLGAVLRIAADDYDPGFAPASDERSVRIARHNRAYGLRWAADIIDQAAGGAPVAVGMAP